MRNRDADLVFAVICLKRIVFLVAMPYLVTFTLTPMADIEIGLLALALG